MYSALWYRWNLWQTWFLCHDQVSLRTFLHKSQVTQLLSLGSTGRGTSSCGITGLGVGIKVRALDFLKGVEQAVLAQQLTAHWGWQAKPLQLFSTILYLWWNPVKGKMCPEEVLELGVLFHISRPLWACWGPLLFSLTPPAQGSGWPKARMALASPLLRNPSHRESASVTQRAHAQAGLVASQCRAPQARLCFATRTWPQWPWELK